jgi:hypothetical protein
LAKRERVAQYYPLLGPLAKSYKSLTAEDWANMREYFGALADGVCEEEGCAVRERLQPHHDHTLVPGLWGFNAYSFLGQEVNLHRIYGKRVIRMLCPPHHRDQHPEHHDADYRRAAKEKSEAAAKDFEAFLAGLRQQKDTSKKAV